MYVFVVEVRREGAACPCARWVYGGREEAFAQVRKLNAAARARGRVIKKTAALDGSQGVLLCSLHERPDDNDDSAGPREVCRVTVRREESHQPGDG